MTKLHLITDKENAVAKYIRLKDGWFNATDAISAVIMPVHEILPYYVMEDLQGKEKYFLGEDWKKSKIWKANDVRLEEGKLIALGRRGKVLGEVSILDKIDMHFPDFSALLKSLKEEKQNIITINIDYVKNIIDAMGVDSYTIGITPMENHRYVIKSFHSEGMGIVTGGAFRQDQLDVVKFRP